MMPAVWNVAEPMEVEYRQPIHQSNDQSNSGRREIEKLLCGEETGKSKIQLAFWLDVGVPWLQYCTWCS